MEMLALEFRANNLFRIWQLIQNKMSENVDSQWSRLGVKNSVEIP